MRATVLQTLLDERLQSARGLGWEMPSGIPPSPPLGKGGEGGLSRRVAGGSLPLEKGGQEGFDGVSDPAPAGIPPSPHFAKGGVFAGVLRVLGLAR